MRRFRRATVYLNRAAADSLGASPGDSIRVFAGPAPAAMRVQAIVDYDGTGTDGAAVLMPLHRAQQLSASRGGSSTCSCPTAAGTSPARR